MTRPTHLRSDPDQRRQVTATGFRRRRAAAARARGQTSWRSRIEHELDARSVRVAVWLHRRTRGRITRLWGRRTVVITAVGRRSGQPRTVLVQAFRDGADLLVVAANGGIGRPPGWYFNLRDHPEAVIDLDGEPIEVAAELLSRSDAERRWPTVLLQAPDYARYLSRTGQVPPIFRLQPITDAPALRPDRLGPQSPAVDHRRRPALALLTAAVAATALVGAAGLATGADPYLRHLTPRLPLRSPALGAVSLAMVVGVPHTLAAFDAFRGDPRSGVSTTAAGTALCGWLLAEYTVLREVSVLDPLYGAVGVAEVIAGRYRQQHGRSAV